MLTPLALLIATLQSVSFYLNNAVNHPLWQFWWIFIVISYLLFAIGNTARSHKSSLKSKTIICANGLLPIAITWLFNDITTIYLCGSWIAIFTVVWTFERGGKASSKWVVYGIGISTTAALLILPVAINRITIKLPSLSGQTSFTAFVDIDQIPILSSSHYQRIRNTKEQIAHLATQVYFTLPHKPPLLRISAQQAGVEFIIQDVIYEHVLGLFKLSLYKLGALNMGRISIIDSNQAIDYQLPAIGGLVINGLPKDTDTLLRLPHLPDHDIELKDHALVLFVRVLMWLFIWLLILTWRPKIKKVWDDHV